MKREGSKKGRAVRGERNDGEQDMENGQSEERGVRGRGGWGEVQKDTSVIEISFYDRLGVRE